MYSTVKGMMNQRMNQRMKRRREERREQKAPKKASKKASKIVCLYNLSRSTPYLSIWLACPHQYYCIRAY
jgi:hypothetical protein